MKKLIYILVPVLLLPSCMSIKGPNGESITMVMTNTGFTTNETNGAGSNVGGIGSGVFNNDSSEQTQLALNGPTGISVGPSGITINSVIDQGTPIDDTLEWVYRGVRAGLVYKGFANLFNNHYGAENAKTAADAGVATSEIEAGTEAARIAAETEQAKIAAEAMEAGASEASEGALEVITEVAE